MAIPTGQLETWANPGPVAIAQTTHESIRHALEVAATSRVKGRAFELFLQGSYRNATNIRGDSDVDLVALLQETYSRDTSQLSQWQREAEQREMVPAGYSWAQFRKDVLDSLIAYYGAAFVVDGNKAIKVRAQPGRLPADVVPTIEHRVYTSYGQTILVPIKYVEGIAFWDKAGNRIVNFPKQHIENGQAKNGAFRTSGNYKPTVRMFKNAREHLIRRGRLREGDAPSYFVECMLYNVPDHLFINDKQETMRGILHWLWTNDKSGFVSQNGLIPLFGNTSVQWQMERADRYVGEMILMWRDWPD